MSNPPPFDALAAIVGVPWRYHSNTDSCSVYGYQDGSIYFWDNNCQLHVIQPRRLVCLLRRALHWPSEEELLRRREQYLLEQLRKQREQRGRPQSPPDEDDDSVMCLD
jgi:hypothetical protein